MSTNRWRVIPGDTIQFLGDRDGFVVGLRDRLGNEYMLPLLSPDVPLPEEPAHYALATSGTPGVALTADGAAYAVPCDFAGIEVSAYVGGPQTVTVHDDADGLSAAVATFIISGVGFFPYSGDWQTAGGGHNLARVMSTGVYLKFSGGTSRTARAIVLP